MVKFSEIDSIECLNKEIEMVDIEVDNDHLFFANGILTHNSTDSDPDMTDTSESFGLPMTVDSLWAFITNEELEEAGQIMVKQLKNRDNDVTKNKRFMIGIDRSRMKLFDLGEDQQTFVDIPENQTPEKIYRQVGKNLDNFKKASILTE